MAKRTTTKPAAVASVGPIETTGNRLLAGLPRKETERLQSFAEFVRPRIRTVLYQQGGPMESVYFPEGGVFSLLTEMSNGDCVENLTVGNEGVIGLPALFGATHSPSRAFCQVPGRALQMPTAAVLEAVPPGSTLYTRLIRYAQARMTSLAQSVACNRLHSATQRYARWLCITHDRVGADEFSITQEFLAQMLGVSRQTVSEIAQELQAAGVIHYTLGRMTVDDRAALEATACECYAVVRAAFDELLGSPRG